MVNRALPPQIQLPRTTADLLVSDILITELGDSPFFDFNTGDFALEGGHLKICKDRDNVLLWIRKTLSTPVGIHPIYTQGYGTPLLNMLGTGTSAIALEVMLPNMIRKSLLRDNRIQEVDNFLSERTLDRLEISFSVKLTNQSNLNIQQSWVIS